MIDREALTVGNFFGLINRRDEDAVRQRKGGGKLALEEIPLARVTARFKDRPYPAAVIRGANRFDGLANRRGMMREIVDH